MEEHLHFNELPDDCIVLGWKGKVTEITKQYQSLRADLPRSPTSDLHTKVYEPLQNALKKVFSSEDSSNKGTVNNRSLTFYLYIGKRDGQDLFRKLQNGEDRDTVVLKDLRNNAGKKNKNKKNGNDDDDNNDDEEKVDNQTSPLKKHRTGQLKEVHGDDDIPILITVKDDAVVKAKNDMSETTSVAMLRSILSLDEETGEECEADKNAKSKKNDSGKNDKDDDEESLTVTTIRALQISIQEGKLDLIKFLLNDPSFMLACDNDGRTLLHYACAGEARENDERKDIFEYLLICCMAMQIEGETRSINDLYNIGDNMGRTAFSYACVYGHFDIVQNLHSRICVDLDVTSDNNGCLPLHFACQEGHYNIVKYLIEKRVSNINATDRFGKTPLHYAICGSKSGESYMIRVPWFTKDEFNFKDNPLNPLHRSFTAEGCGRCRIVELLIKNASVDVNACNNIGCSALHYACGGGSSRFLEDCDASNTNPCILSFGGCRQCLLRIVKMLVLHGKANVDAIDNYGRTPLHYACRCGNYALAEYLIRSGTTNANTKTYNGLSALHFASQHGYSSIVECLIRFGDANVNAAANNGMTALHFASVSGRSKIVRFLIENYVDIEAKEWYGKTALHLACEHGQYEVAEILIAVASANVNATSSNGWTALHFSCAMGFIAIVKLLARSFDVNVDSLTDKNETALHLACEHGYSNIVRYLVDDLHANINVITADGWTPMECARRCGFLDIEALLAGLKRS